MIMDARPLPGLPFYSASPHCQVCGVLTEHRIEMIYPVRGLLLACGTCAHLALGGMRDPFEGVPRGGAGG